MHSRHYSKCCMKIFLGDQNQIQHCSGQIQEDIPRTTTASALWLHPTGLIGQILPVGRGTGVMVCILSSSHFCNSAQESRSGWYSSGSPYVAACSLLGAPPLRPFLRPAYIVLFVEVWDTRAQLQFKQLLTQLKVHKKHPLWKTGCCLVLWSFNSGQ